MQPNENSLTALAEERSRHYRFHGTRMLKWSGWIAGWTLIANILVPFGLVTLLYIPASFHRTITLVSLAISGLALALQLLSNSQHFRDRSVQLRAMHYELEKALAEYRTGLRTDAELSAALTNVEKHHMQELLP